MTRRERRLARAERLRGWAAKRAAKGAAGFDRAHQIADGIPFGQPILVGHHSEGRARRDADRIDAGMRAGVENGRKAEEMGQRVANIERATEHAIYSDDTDATERLQKRIASLEAKQARMKGINAAIRKGTSLDTLDLTGREKADLINNARHSGIKGYPAYALSNNNANLKRYQGRLKALQNPRPPRPHWITVRFPGECVMCQRTIERGETAQYSRESRELCCQTCAS